MGTEPKREKGKEKWNYYNVGNLIFLPSYTQMCSPFEKKKKKRICYRLKVSFLLCSPEVTNVLDSQFSSHFLHLHECIHIYVTILILSFCGFIFSFDNMPCKPFHLSKYRFSSLIPSPADGYSLRSHFPGEGAPTCSPTYNVGKYILTLTPVYLHCFSLLCFNQGQISTANLSPKCSTNLYYYQQFIY